MINLPEPDVKMKKLDSEPTDASSNQSQQLQSVDLHLQPRAKISGDDDGKQQPLTIFYDGNVCVSNVTHQQARTILYLARREMELERMAKSPKGSGGSGPASSSWQPYQTYSPNNTASMKRSLQMFLQKRKSRSHSTPASNP
ncbi:hypothetical protein SAY87_003486 [Trapa incisa]|uniref:Protein TIFY n=1 Tax=Trapa incisa TaxID=236973 RepID=A0AAN7KKN2_9MYRT|nr:hypothetical protein SAY87_003486 [Trapa incisa]